MPRHDPPGGADALAQRLEVLETRLQQLYVTRRRRRPRPLSGQKDRLRLPPLSAGAPGENPGYSPPLAPRQRPANDTFNHPVPTGPFAYAAYPMGPPAPIPRAPVWPGESFGMAPWYGWGGPNASAMAGMAAVQLGTMQTLQMQQMQQIMALQQQMFLPLTGMRPANVPVVAPAPALTPAPVTVPAGVQLDSEPNEPAVLPQAVEEAVPLARVQRRRQLRVPSEVLLAGDAAARDGSAAAATRVFSAVPAAANAPPNVARSAAVNVSSPTEARRSAIASGNGSRPPMDRAISEIAAKSTIALNTSARPARAQANARSTTAQPPSLPEEQPAANNPPEQEGRRQLNVDAARDTPTVFFGTIPVEPSGQTVPPPAARRPQDLQRAEGFVACVQAWSRMLKTQYPFRNAAQILVDSANTGDAGLDFFAAVSHVKPVPGANADALTLERPASSTVTQVAARVSGVVSNVISALEMLTYEKLKGDRDAISFPALLLRDLAPLPSSYLFVLEKSKLRVDPVSGSLCQLSTEQRRMLFLYCIVVRIVVAHMLMHPVDSGLVDKGVPVVLRNHYFGAYVLYRVVRLACFTTLPNHPDLIMREFHANACGMPFPPPLGAALELADSTEATASNATAATASGEGTDLSARLRSRRAFCFYPWDVIKVPAFELLSTASAVAGVDPLETQLQAAGIDAASAAAVTSGAAVAVPTVGNATNRPARPEVPPRYLEGTVGPLSDALFQQVFDRMPALRSHAGRLINWSNSWVQALTDSSLGSVPAAVRPGGSAIDSRTAPLPNRGLSRRDSRRDTGSSAWALGGVPATLLDPLELPASAPLGSTMFPNGV